MPKLKKEYKSTSIRLDPDIVATVHSLANISEMSVSEMIRVLIQLGLPRYEAWRTKQLKDKRLFTTAVLEQLSLLENQTNEEIQQFVNEQEKK
jgi:Mn-dependent DtxR family transcriptional regulator